MVLVVSTDELHKWDNHNTSQIKKCSKRLFLLRQLNKLKVDYNAMISSVATYVIGSWYNSCGTTLLHQLAWIEKQATKLIQKQDHQTQLTPASVYKTSAIASTEKIMAESQSYNKFKSKVISYEDFCNNVLNQPIWGNKFIKFKNKTLFFKHWIAEGIVSVKI